MNIFSKTTLIASILLVSGAAQAGAIISDGDIKLGVNDDGSLNFGSTTRDVAGETVAGMRYVDSATGDEYESTSHGCLCEGWGVGIADTGEFGWANVADGGNVGLSVGAIASTATTATSTTSLTSGNLAITHDFALAAETDNLYRVTVTIENTSGADIANLRYRRSMDWDTSPTPFDEFVTIGGTAGATDVLASSDDGFCSSNPFSACGGILEGPGDFEASGPADHGANFDFDFGALAAGDSKEFEIYYGAAIGKTAALGALAAVGAEVYSFGWSADDVDQDGAIDSTGALAPTFIFGFGGVGGTVVTVPVPATLALMGLGLLGLGAVARRKAKLAA